MTIGGGWSDRGRDDFEFLMSTNLSPDVSSECPECGRQNVAKVRPIERDGRIILRWRNPNGKLHAELMSEPVARLVRILGLHEAARLIGNLGGTTILLPRRAKEGHGESVRGIVQSSVARMIEAFGPTPLEVPEDKPFVARVIWSHMGMSRAVLARILREKPATVGKWISKGDPSIERTLSADTSNHEPEPLHGIPVKGSSKAADGDQSQMSAPPGGDKKEAASGLPARNLAKGSRW